MPAMLTLQDWRVDPIEVAAAGDCRCYGNRIANLHAGRLGVRRHREISHRAGKVRRRIWRQGFHFKTYRVTFDLYFPTFGQLSEGVRKEWIVKWITEVEGIEGRASARRARLARHRHLRSGLYRTDLKFSRSRRGNRGFKRHHIVRFAANRLHPFPGLL